MFEVLSALFDPNDPAFKCLSVRLACYEGAPIENLSSYYTETLYHMILGGISAAHKENAIKLASIKGGNSLMIFLFMHGGPSQIETFDPKMSAPEIEPPPASFRLPHMASLRKPERRELVDCVVRGCGNRPALVETASDFHSGGRGVSRDAL